MYSKAAGKSTLERSIKIYFQPKVYAESLFGEDSNLNDGGGKNNDDDDIEQLYIWHDLAIGKQHCIMEM